MWCKVRCLLGSTAKDDNFIAQLFSKWTVIILVVFSFVITCKLWFGDSFTCVTSADLQTSFLRQHCYATGTYVIISSWQKVPGKDDVPYRGIDKTVPDETRAYLTYYGWVNIFLLVQAFNFCLPRLLWKAYEQGFLTKLVSGIDECPADNDRKKESIDVLARYLVASQGKNLIYSMVYICYEVWNHVVAIGQTLFLLYFFRITGVPEEHPEITLDTWDEFASFYFPLVSKCSYRKYGASGVVQRYEALCSVPLNTLYMYVFLFLYGWYIFLGVLSGLNLLYRLSMFIPKVRLVVLRLKAPLAHVSDLQSICCRSSFSDWFVLSRVQKNLRRDNFADLVARIAAANDHSEKAETFDAFDRL